MRKFVLFIIIAIILPAIAYEVYSPENYYLKNDSENILFVVDFSNSMSEYLEHKKKTDSVKTVLNNILPQLPQNIKAGLRVYGHTCNVLAFNACKSSELLVPISDNNNQKISSAISNLKPKGMTPITYSLKQAVNKDFSNINGNKRIILLTDGGENCDISPCEYSISLMKTRRDINIDVIAFNVEDADDLAQLKCTADVTGGRFIKADTNAQLLQSMNDLLIPFKKVEALILQNN
ncbi:MAG: VWA domain-containing protein [bacterium]|nr:VWA domain-containing protein [bacterium]